MTEPELVRVEPGAAGTQSRRTVDPISEHRHSVMRSMDPDLVRASRPRPEHDTRRRDELVRSDLESMAALLLGGQARRPGPVSAKTFRCPRSLRDRCRMRHACR